MSNEDDDDKETLDLDPQTQAVLHKKGYQIDKKLSQGSFGQVFKGRNVKENEDVAIKVMFIYKLGEYYTQHFWPSELAALRDIRHDHIISVFDIFRSAGKLFIFLEFANGGDITSYMKHHRGPIEESIACYWFKQCTQAMTYMHNEHNFAHRDIKIDNVLLHNLRAKVTDFGFACRVTFDKTTNKVNLSQTNCGTAPYYSPQLVSLKPYNAFAADVWAMGVMLFVMLNNKYPFHFCDTKKFFKEQNTPNFIHDRFIGEFPDDLIDLLERIFVIDEEKRIQMADILKHPWIVRKGKPTSNISTKKSKRPKTA